jgi:lipoic acid synthetase
VARRQVSLKVLENGSQIFEVRHRWEDRTVAPPPDGAPTEYLPFRQQKGLHGRPDWLKAKAPAGEGYRDIKEHALVRILQHTDGQADRARPR